MDLNTLDIKDDNLDEELYSIVWSDIENAEMDYENYLNDIESFFTDEWEEEYDDEGDYEQ